MQLEELKNKIRDSILNLKSCDSTKESVRSQLLSRRSDVCKTLGNSVLSCESRAISLLRRVKYPDVYPDLVKSSENDYALWSYLRNVLSSGPWEGRPGRSIRYFVIDKNSRGILGVADLGSEVMALNKRDEYIGWSVEDKLKNGGLRRIVNLGSCLPAQPFGWLCGGKFISEATSTIEISREWKLRYNDDLAIACTTSLFGKSSQYNRLPHWTYLGNTAGSAPHSLMPQQDRKRMQLFIRITNSEVRKGYGLRIAGFVDTFIEVCKQLKIDVSTLCRGQPRGVYISELYPGALHDLRMKRTTGFAPRTIDNASLWWIERWRDMRWPKVSDKIKSFNWNRYLMKNVISAGSKDNVASPDQGE